MNDSTHQTERRRPLTNEQIEMMANHTERAARKALRNYRNGAVVGFIVLLIGVILAFAQTTSYHENARKAIVDSGKAVAVIGCNRDFRDRQQERALLRAARSNVRGQARRGEISPSQLEDSLRFYDRELDRLRLPDCRDTLDALTDDPNARIRIPDPLYPGSPQQ